MQKANESRSTAQLRLDLGRIHLEKCLKERWTRPHATDKEQKECKKEQPARAEAVAAMQRDLEIKEEPMHTDDERKGSEQDVVKPKTLGHGGIQRQQQARAEAVAAMERDLENAEEAYIAAKRLYRSLVMQDNSSDDGSNWDTVLRVCRAYKSTSLERLHVEVSALCCRDCLVGIYLCRHLVCNTTLAS